MGNWRRANVVGTCDEEDVPCLRNCLSVGFEDDMWGPLHNGGIAGLPNWADTSFNVSGNLGERGYDEDSIADALVGLAEECPSLRVKVHLGGDYEADECTHTITLGESGEATVGDPEIEEVPKPNQAQMQGNLMSQLMGGRR